MSAAAPWSVKGIDPKTREVAKDLARRSGMTLGEWLNSMIVNEDDDDDAVSTFPRRPHMSDMFERRGRSRRLDDAYGSSDEGFHRVAASVGAIAERLEAAERRSTLAIQGVDQAVAGLVRRLETQDQTHKTQGRRIDDIAEELREGHRRLRAFEQQVGPSTQESFGKMETAIAAVTSRLYDIEERQRASVNEVRGRMDAVEKAAGSYAGAGAGAEVLAQVSTRLDGAQTRTSEALRSLERSFAALDQKFAGIDQKIGGLDQRSSGLEQRLRAAESRVEPEGAREAARFEKLAETLARQVEANRSEMMRRLDTAETEGRIDRVERAVAAVGETLRASEQRSAQSIEAMGREVMRIAQNLSGRLDRGEKDAAGRLDALTRDLSASLGEKMDRDMGRYAQAIDQRLTRADDQHAIALERLGGEITRISDRLADRIAQSERKSAQALEEIGQRLAESSTRIEQRHDRASGELAERMRLSEERTAQLLAEARDSIEKRVDRVEREAPVPEPRRAVAEPRLHPEPQADWRAAAFPEDSFGPADDIWAADPAEPPALAAEQIPAPFPGSTSGAVMSPEAFAGDPLGAIFDDPSLGAARTQPTFEPHFEPEPEPVIEPAVDAAPPPVFGRAQAADAFGGADVEAALRATAEVRPVSGFDTDPVDYAGETDFIDPGSIRQGMRAGAAAGRASTRSTIDAARAAMAVAPEPEPQGRSGFGLNLKRGGKSRLQERLDKQANKDGSVVRKTLLASVTGMAVVAGVYATGRIAAAEGVDLPGLEAIGLGAPPAESVEPLAAVALTPTEATPVAGSEAQTLYDQAIETLATDPAKGVETLTQAANLGMTAAQLKLASLNERGESGVTRNLTKARLWARRAAEGGDPRGMHAFGMYLYEGVGGARNRAEAVDWLTKAADRGLIDSQYNVARIYESGDEGVAANTTDAFKWYLIAARGGDQDAQAAVNRLTGELPATARRAARTEASAFQVEPLG